MSDFTATKDYKLHKKIHEEFLINEKSLNLLNRARIISPLIYQDSDSTTVLNELNDILKRAQPIYKYVNEVQPYMLSNKFRGNTISNLNVMEEIITMIAKRYHLEAFIKIDNIKYQEYVDNPIEILNSKIKWVTCGDKETKPTKANIKKHRNNVKVLCDVIAVNELILTDYMLEHLINYYNMVKIDYKIFLAELKSSDIETMEYLDKKIKTFQLK